MKKTALLLALALVACSPGNKETSQQDSTSVGDSVLTAGNDSVDVKADDYEAYVVETEDTSAIAIKYEAYKVKFEEGSGDYYEINISYNLYEAGSSVKWLFDDSFSPRYFKEDWSVEGSEGYSEYFIENDEVVCAEENDNMETKKWCQGVQGVKILVIDENGNTTSEPLADDYEKSVNQTFKSKLDAIQSILNEGEVTQKNDNSYTVRIEKTVDYGQEVTETVELTIPKKVYEALTRSVSN